MTAIETWIAALLMGVALLGPAPAQPDASTKTDRLLAALDSLPPGASLTVIAETDGPPTAVADLARARDIQVGWTYDLIDAFSATVTREQLDDLASLPGVARVWDSAPVQTLMDNSVRDIDADKAWTGGYTGSGVTVAVIDTGLDLLDPAFSGAVVSCVSTISAVVSPECTDSDGHGTHVAGTVASRDATYKGVAHGAKLAIVRVLHAAGSGTSADIIAGMNWVKNHRTTVSPAIRVATMSIGFLDPGCGNGQGPEAKAADALVAAGVSFTIAAGNAGHNSCTVDGASAAFNVVTVGAVDDRNTPGPLDDTLAGFSSGGPTTDGRLKPEVVAPGVNIKSVYLGPTVATLSGTSMATPHVAGTIALLLQKEPSLTPAQVKGRLTSTTVHPTADNPTADNDWGYGLVNACKALVLTGCQG